jgi:hypothetical protein
MDVQPLAQRNHWTVGPVHHYEVVFWRQPHVAPEDLPEGVTQERVVWAASGNDVLDARDVVEVLAWADAQARARESIFTLYAVVDYGGREGTVWLAGWDPTVWSRPNFADRQPRDVDPVSGTPSDVYGSPGPSFA